MRHPDLASFLAAVETARVEVDATGPDWEGSPQFFAQLHYGAPHPRRAAAGPFAFGPTMGEALSALIDYCHANPETLEDAP